MLTESKSSWRPNNSGLVNKSIDLLNIGIRPDKRYGFVVYDADAEMLSLIATDSMEEMADALSIETEEIEDLWDLKVGQSDKDVSRNTITTRIW